MYKRNFSHRDIFLYFEKFSIRNDITGKSKIQSETTGSMPNDSTAEICQAVLKED
jgi:hypothetical protein